jgi:hypothetical protein
MLEGDGSGPAPTRGVVLVHGAGNFEPGYEKPIMEYIQNRLGGREIPFKTVIYSDEFKNWLMPQTRATMWDQNKQFQAFHKGFCNEAARDRILRDAAFVSLSQMAGAVAPLINFNSIMSLVMQSSSNANALMGTISQMTSNALGFPIQQVISKVTSALQPPASATTATLVASSAPSAASLGSGGLDLSLVVEMVYHYLYDNVMATQVQQIVEQTLLEATQEFDEVVLVSHSLGNLVAFDVLNKWTHGATKVTDWFTLGCPLIKSRRLHPGDPGPDHLPPGRVERWYNVYDTNDIVADALGPDFGKPGSYIYDVYVEVGSDPLSAHDYMNSNATRDMIADALV